MTALTLRLPNDKHARLKAMARRRGTSINRLIEEMATLTLAEFDAETRFLARAGRGRGKAARGLALLTKAAKGRGTA
jgi:predicted transcriptional regulator